MPWTRNGVRPSRAASSSKTRMNSSPTRRRFSSGSVTPSRRARNRSSASTCTSGTWKCCWNVSTTWAASSLRSRPWSTKTQVSWSPIALCTSSAATDESTPPESAQSTRSLPTWARMRSTCSSITAAAVHAGGTRRRRRGSSSGPPGRAACARPRGGTGRRRARAPGPRTRRPASPATRAVTAAPSGGAVTVSRWLIQAVCSSGRPVKSGARRGAELRLAELARRPCARRGRRGRAPSAARRSRCRARGRRARRGPGRSAARRRRTPRRARR